jgi:hypothetical protein
MLVHGSPSIGAD